MVKIRETEIYRANIRETDLYHKIKVRETDIFIAKSERDRDSYNKNKRE